MHLSDKRVSVHGPFGARRGPSPATGASQLPPQGCGKEGGTRVALEHKGHWACVTIRPCAMDHSRILTKPYPPAQEGAIIVVATLIFKGDEAVFPGCIMYHRVPPEAQSGDKRGADAMNDEPLADRFWVTSLPPAVSEAMPSGPVVAGLCLTDAPRKTGPTQIALMVSGVATVKVAAVNKDAPEPSPGEILSVVQKTPAPPQTFELRTERHLSPDHRFLLHWPRNIKPPNLSGFKDLFENVLGNEARLVFGNVINEDSDSNDRRRAAAYLAFMSGMDADKILKYLNAELSRADSRLDLYAHPFGAFARVLDSGPGGTVRVLLRGVL